MRRRSTAVTTSCRQICARTAARVISVRTANAGKKATRAASINRSQTWSFSSGVGAASTSLMSCNVCTTAMGKMHLPATSEPHCRRPRSEDMRSARWREQRGSKRRPTTKRAREEETRVPCASIERLGLGPSHSGIQDAQRHCREPGSRGDPSYFGQQVPDRHHYRRR